jgi:hypothetical protein
MGPEFLAEKGRRCLWGLRRQRSNDGFEKKEALQRPRVAKLGYSWGMQPTAKDVAQALRQKERIFGLTLQNIPTINLRQQYRHDRTIAFEDGLAESIHAWRFGQTLAPTTVSYPDPDGYFTMLLRSTIVGIECILKASAIEELAFSNRLTEPLMQSIRQPRKLSRSMAEAFFNKIPELVDASACLKTRNSDLWDIVQRFYGEVRNPISHGDQLSDVKAESIRAVFEMFDQIYAWVDSWSCPDRIQRILKSTTFQMLK